jgi:tripartite-type tricarboxylate transporter receptor subunit TctC
VGSDWAIGAWRGIVGPAGLPEDVTARLIEALDAVFNSDEYKEFMLGRGFGIRWASGEEFAEFMADSNQALGDTMRAVGLVQ